jgi:hypothetical protein
VTMCPSPLTDTNQRVRNRSRLTVHYAALTAEIGFEGATRGQVLDSRLLLPAACSGDQVSACLLNAFVAAVTMGDVDVT